MNILLNISTHFADILFGFAFYYPLFMSYVWMTGAIYYYHHWEKKLSGSYKEVPPLASFPGVSIVVPCHNEAENIPETIRNLMALKYPNFEIIAINDGSTDDTGKILDELSAEHEKLRVIHMATNQGKAMGLRMGAMASPHEYLLCLDADAILDPNAASWIMFHLINGPRVGAVTGNPRIRTRSTLLGKIQVGELSAIIGLIKRAQRIYGRIFTISGVVAGFRKAALHEAGYWSLDALTEDIDISWKLQLKHWDVRYEPNALCWILAPETLGGLWRQRLRWARGGSDVMIRNFRIFSLWKLRRMWPVYIEYFTSVLWSYTILLVFILWLTGKFVAMPPNWYIKTIVPGWNGVILGITCLFQFLVSLALDSRYEKGIGKYYYWMIWYPMIYWFINTITTVVALPMAVIRRRGERAVWKSPDRGLRP